MTPPTPNLKSALEARIVRREALQYTAGGCEVEDRPAFVRAASGVIRVGDDLCILQDDASFIAVVAPDRTVRAIPLPRGPGGRRRFEEALENRLSKLDLECGEALVGPNGPLLLAFGSGSLAVREVAVLVDPRSTTEPEVVDASGLFAAFRAAIGVPRAVVNLEGCAAVGPTLRLFQRGPVSASVDFDRGAVHAWVAAGGRAEAPRAGSVRRYDLGSAGAVAYGFSDATALPDGRVVFLAVAEDTDDPVIDGTVHGSVFGVIEGDSVRTGPILGIHDQIVIEKAEGIATDPTRPGRFWVTLDPDDPSRPAELCDLEVRGL